jgi:hypothetical protein
MNARAHVAIYRRRLVVAVLLVYPTVVPAEQSTTVSPAVRQALELCDAADSAPLPDRAAILTRGLERAEEAVEANPQDATAHFAVFCNLGKRTDLQRRTHGFLGLLRDVERARRELDEALTLAPDDPAALAAKGQMLTELPRFLGGDPAEGERLLRRAAALDPSAVEVRRLSDRSE